LKDPVASSLGRVTPNPGNCGLPLFAKRLNVEISLRTSRALNGTKPSVPTSMRSLQKPGASQQVRPTWRQAARARTTKLKQKVNLRVFFQNTLRFSLSWQPTPGYRPSSLCIDGLLCGWMVALT
jgi:hypothetical protein